MGSRQSMAKLGPLILVVTIPFLLYLYTLYPGVGDRQGTGDSIEFQFVGRILSIPHEPGYPQYVLLSHLWTFLPLPLSLAAKINLLSALFTTLAGLFFYSTTRILAVRTSASVLATLALLSAFDIWLLATQAEVYSLNLFWVSAVIWAAVRWNQSKRQRNLILLFFFYALSFGNHLTMIVLLPGLAFLVLAREPKVLLRWQNWVWAATAIATGVLQYGLLLWRSYHPHPALLRWFPLQATIPELWSYITGGRFFDKHWLKTGPADWPPRVWEVLSHGMDQLSLVLVLFAGFGAYVCFKRDRRLTISLGIVVAGIVSFAAAYVIKDSLLYAIPAWLCLALWGALGIDETLRRFAPWRRPLLIALTALLGLRMAIGVGALRIGQQPADLTTTIEAAESGSGILAGLRKRRARLVEAYYRYGLASEKAEHLSFYSTPEVFATGLEAIDDLPLYFQSSRIAAELEKRWVDYRPVVTGKAGTTVYLTGTEHPIHRLELRSLWNRNLALVIRDRSQDLVGEHAVHLMLISGEVRRSKGYVTFDTQGDDNWETDLEEALSVAMPGDWWLLVLPPLEGSARSRVWRTLSLRGIEIGTDQTPQFQTIVFWQSGNALASQVVVRDLEGSLDLDIGGQPARMSE